MLKQWKKAIALAMMAAMLVLAAGCGNSGETAGDGASGSESAATTVTAATAAAAEGVTEAPSESATEAASESAAAAPTESATEAADESATADPRFSDASYTLKWAVVGWENQPDYDSVMKALNAKFAELGYPGLNVEVIGFSWADFDAGKMGTFVMGGEDYDIIWAPSWVNFRGNAQDAGAWQDWQPYIDIAPAYAQMLAPYREDIKTWHTGDDGETQEQRIMFLPTFKEFGSAMCAMRFNKTVAEKLGIAEQLYGLKDIDELDQYLQMFKDAYPERAGALSADSNALMSYFNKSEDANPFGPVYDPATDSYTIGVYEPWFENYLQTTRSWRDKGFILPYEDTAANIDEMQTKFGPESFLVWFSTGKPGGEAELNMNSAALGFEWGEVILTDPILSVGSILGNPYALNAHSQNPEAAAFIYETICTSAELNNILNFGVEGVHYSLAADGIMERVADSGYYPGIMPWFGNRMLCLPLPGEPADITQVYKEYNDSAVRMKNFGYGGITDAYKPDNWDGFWGVHGALWAEYARSAQVGSLTDAQLAEMREKLDAIDAKAVIDACNASYANWKASQ
jgi:putative aldouronate transport system substrate-binding protein